MVLKPLEMVELEGFRLFCMGDSPQTAKDHTADRNLVSKKQALEVSSGKDCTGLWAPHDIYFFNFMEFSKKQQTGHSVPETGDV